MAKDKGIKEYESQLRSMIKARTNAPCEKWLTPQIRTTAMNMVMLDKIQNELVSMASLIAPLEGSKGQIKNEVSPLLPHYDKTQRTLLMQFEALGLNYATTPSKVKEDTKKGADTSDPMTRMIADAQNVLNDEL